MSTSVEKPPVPAKAHVVVVGAGFAGLYMMYRLQKLGIDATAFEAGSDVGGTWFWNRYPGARCDVESLEYSYSFSDDVQQAWHWKERYATQPEILNYINHVADTFDLRRHIHFNTRVAGAEFDSATGLWSVTTEHGDVVSARYCVMATGCLSEAAVPKIPGLDRFEGKAYHTGQWPKERVDFSGQRVGVIGTGSSGIQVITQVAKQAGHLHVFQRTANYSLPAHNRPMDSDVERRTKDRYAELREKARRSQSGVASFGVPDKSVLEVSDEERRRTLQERWDAGGLGFTRAYNDVLMNEESNRAVAEFVREKIRGLVRDPKVAELLTPTYLIGTKRLCADTGYFETFNRDNVTLVDIKSDPIVEITETGVRTGKRFYALDALILATGFDAITGALLRMNIRSKDGSTLRQLWEHGPRTFMGLMTAGLPNLFMITGPGSPSVLSNVVVSVEQHVEWISDCIHWLDTHGVSRMEADPKAQDDWVAHVNEIANKSLFPRGASWYVGANIPGKPRVFTPYIGGVGTYRKLCDEVAANGYKPFLLSGGAGAHGGVQSTQKENNDVHDQV